MKYLTVEQLKCLQKNWCNSQCEFIEDGLEVFRRLRIPDEFTVHVMTSPAEVWHDPHDGKEYSLVAVSRKVRGKFWSGLEFGENHIDRAKNREEMFDCLVSDIEMEFSTTIAQNKNVNRFLWAPYHTHHLTPVILAPEDFTYHRSPLIRYAKKNLG